MKKITTQPSLYQGPLRMPKMSCDKPLTDSRVIKPPWPSNSAFFLAVIGPPGSGKTTMVLASFAKQVRGDNIYHKTFHKITYVCPLSSQASIVNSPLSDLDPADIFSDLTTDVFDRVSQNFEEFQKSKDPDQQQVLIVDDCGATLKGAINAEMLNNLSMNRRHLHLSIILIGQYSISIPRSVRAQLSVVCLYKPSRQDRAVIQAEYTDLNKNQFNHLAKFVWQNPHDHLWIHLGSNQMWKNLEKLEFE